MITTNPHKFEVIDIVCFEGNLIHTQRWITTYDCFATCFTPHNQLYRSQLDVKTNESHQDCYTHNYNHNYAHLYQGN